MNTYEADYRFMIEQAVKAPSGHNTQPWLFKIKRNSIELLPDDSKILHVVDNNRRELFVSLGCAVENLCLAASVKGYEIEVKMSDEGYITITLIKGDNTSSETNLYAQINKRQTNRSRYNGKMIPDHILVGLLSVKRETDINIHSWQKGSVTYHQIANYVTQGNKIQMSAPLFRNELKQWMRYNRKHVEQTHDGLSYAVFGAPNLPRWISSPVMKACLTPNAQNKTDRKNIESSSYIVLFTVKKNSREEWIGLGRVLQRFLLHTTQAGVATAFINQPCELPLLSEQMKRDIQEIGEDEIPVILLRIGYADKLMPYSPRKEINKVIIND